MKITEIPTDKHDCPNVSFLEVEGLKATQSHRVIDFLKLLKKEGFQIAIEIGTQEGGFALLVKKYLGCDVHTWDIVEWNPIVLRQKLFREYGVNYRIEDCFEDKNLLNLLHDKRKKIVFCDGGHKGNEFNFFADHINEGDFIGAHDYFPTVEERDNDIWTTCELVYNDIKPAVEKYEMKQVYNDSLKAAWAMYKK